MMQQLANTAARRDGDTSDFAIRPARKSPSATAASPPSCARSCGPGGAVRPAAVVPDTGPLSHQEIAGPDGVAGFPAVTGDCAGRHRRGDDGRHRLAARCRTGRGAAGCQGVYLLSPVRHWPGRLPIGCDHCTRLWQLFAGPGAADARRLEERGAIVLRAERAGAAVALVGLGWETHRGSGCAGGDAA